MSGLPLRSVFVTVGTTRFDDLVSAVFSPDVLDAFRERGVERLTVQIGNSDAPLEPCADGLTVSSYQFKPSLAEDLESSSLVISHAGAGSIFEALRANKPLVVVVNDKLADNHQTELATAMSERRHCYACGPSTLAKILREMDLKKLKPLPSSEPGLKAFSATVDDLMGFPTDDDAGIPSATGPVSASGRENSGKKRASSIGRSQKKKE